MKEKCDYCGENKAMKTIPNPNSHEEGTWEVCLMCEEVIGLQFDISFNEMMAHNCKIEIVKKMSDRNIAKAKKRLSEISYEADIPIFSASITTTDINTENYKK